MGAVDAPAESFDAVAVHREGEVDPADVEYGRAKIAKLARLAPGPVQYARLDLAVAADPARARPAEAKARLAAGGRQVRAHVAAATLREAIDALDARLRDLLERARDRAADAHLRHRDDAWHRGDEPAARPPIYPRPPEEREIVRHKSFAPAPLTPEEAVLDAMLLDHDFFLFVNSDTGADSVVFRTEGGWFLMHPDGVPDAASPVPVRGAPAIPRTLAGARELLDASDDRFVFFLDPDTGRGRVLYRRYDGHYGLITPER
jgi:ribosome-associated translation inhibitor RaiA